MDGTSSMSLQEIINLAMTGSGTMLAPRGEAVGQVKQASAVRQAPVLASVETVQRTVNTVADMIIKEAEAGPGVGPGALHTFPSANFSGKPGSAIDPGKARAADKMRAPSNTGSRQTSTDAPTMMENNYDHPISGKTADDRAKLLAAVDRMGSKTASGPASQVKATLDAVPELKQALIEGAQAKGKGSAALIGAMLGTTTAVPAAYLGARHGAASKDKVAERLDAALGRLLKRASDGVNIQGAHHEPPLPVSNLTGSGSTMPIGEGSQLVSSNASAMSFSKQQAKAKPKKDMEALMGEPVQRASNDKVLSQALSHTSGPGVSNKIASVVQMDPALISAQLLLNRLAGSV
jgi:hypothetical protein